MPPTDQYRANLYKAWKCPHNNLIGIDPISTDILVYDPFSNLPLIELLGIIKALQGHTSSTNILKTTMSKNTNNF